MHSHDFRWEQRFQNYLKAFALLEEAVLRYQAVGLSELQQHGLIQRFECTHELAWNVLKDYFEYQGNPAITGTRDATREAFNKGLIEDGEGWMEMIKSRNQGLLSYDEGIARELVEAITSIYFHLFGDLSQKLISKKDTVQ